MDPLAALLDEQQLQLLSASELQSRITLLEGATRACRAELESRPSSSRAGTPMDALPNEIRQHIFSQLCNVLEPRDAVDFSSASQELRALTPALLQQLRADHELAAALCRKVGMRSCKELREAKEIDWWNKELTADDLGLLGTLGSVMPALEVLRLWESSAGPEGVQRLVEGLGAGALPSVTKLALMWMHVDDAGASALAAALGGGALPRLKILKLNDTALSDAGLVALAPVLWRLPALERLHLTDNSFGDEGLAALMVPPPRAGAPPPPTGGLTKLQVLDLIRTQVTDAGCAILAAALDIGSLPTLLTLNLHGIPASAAAQAAVDEALTTSTARRHTRGTRRDVPSSSLLTLS